MVFYNDGFGTYIKSSTGSSPSEQIIGSILKYLSILGHNIFICQLLDYQNGGLCPLQGAKN